MALPLDYETLKVLWWALVGILLIGFALADGYDLGVQTLLPFVARNDRERRLVINSVAPTWEGHQVWLITGGGALFAAWPFVYAISFSGFYLAMFVVLAALILRPVGFKYRSKRESAAWRASNAQPVSRAASATRNPITASMRFRRCVAHAPQEFRERTDTSAFGVHAQRARQLARTVRRVAGRKFLSLRE